MKLGEKVSSQSTSRVRDLALELAATTYASLKMYFRYPLRFLGTLLASPLWLLVIIIPLLLFLPYEEWHNPQTFQHFYWGMVIWGVISSSLWSIGHALRSEQYYGTLELKFLTNANRMIVFSGSIVPILIETAIDACYTAVLIWAIFGTPVTIVNPVQTLLAFVLAIACSMAFGASYAAVVLILKETGPLTNIVQFILVILCGAYYPISKIPQPYRMVSYFIPLTYAIDLLKHYAIGTPTVIDPLLELLVVILSTAVMALIGKWTIEVAERRCKKTGKLGFY